MIRMIQRWFVVCAACGQRIEERTPYKLREEAENWDCINGGNYCPVCLPAARLARAAITMERAEKAGAS